MIFIFMDLPQMFIVKNILPILSYCDLYEKEIGISLTTEKNKFKMILDFYLNLLDKNNHTPY